MPLPKYFIFVCLINIIFWLWAREPTRCSTLCIFANGNDYANLSQEQKLEQRWWWWGWWLWLWRWSRLLDNLDIRCQMEIRSSRSSAHNKSTCTRGILGVSKVYMGLSVAIPTLNIIKEMRDEGDCASFLMQIQIQLKWTISNRNEQFRILKLALDEESAELTFKCESRIYIGQCCSRGLQHLKLCALVLGGNCITIYYYAMTRDGSCFHPQFLLAKYDVIMYSQRLLCEKTFNLCKLAQWVGRRRVDIN